jgi:hypothetical protein
MRRDISEVGRLVLWLYRRSSADAPPEAERLLEALANGCGDVQDPFVSAGIAIRNGQGTEGLARAVSRAASDRLRDPATLLAHIDQNGYTQATVRAVLQVHYLAFKNAPLGSDEQLVYVDVSNALPRLLEQERQVAYALIKGYRPKEIETAFGSNGSRLCRQVAAAIVRVLEASH